LSPDSAAEGSGKLSPAAIQKLSARLAELVGDDAGGSQHRNEEGQVCMWGYCCQIQYLDCLQLLNEEGLPIIDIEEPIPVSDAHSASEFLDEDAPIPAAALPISEQERRRRERDRILDQLEEEEQMELAKGEETSQEQRQEILRKRKEAAQDEIARLKAAKDMQRKMGKALLRDMATSRDETKPTQTPDIAVQEAHDAPPAPKKTVTFVDAEPEVETPESPQGETSDWGDVVPARLRANSGRSLMSSSQFGAHPMKMQVVERTPGRPVEEPQPDSDDESEPPDSPTIADSDEEGGLESDEELAEEIDLDFASHQREIALEYHTKRAKMAETTSNAMQSHFLNDASHKTVRPIAHIPVR
jgi:hypothetical protein